MEAGALPMNIRKISSRRLDSCRLAKSLRPAKPAVRVAAD
jgi:hypothetical protein